MDHPSTAVAGHAGVVAYPPYVLAAAVAAGLLLHLAWPRHLASWPLSIGFGLAAGLASAALALWARAQLVAAGTPVDPDAGTTALVTSGPYAWTRNPLYAAQGLLLVMAAGLVNGVAVIAMFVPWLAVMWIGVVAREERYLSARFGEPYERYRARVRRWL